MCIYMNQQQSHWNSAGAQQLVQLPHLQQRCELWDFAVNVPMGAACSGCDQDVKMSLDVRKRGPFPSTLTTVSNARPCKTSRFQACFSWLHFCCSGSSNPIGSHMAAACLKTFTTNLTPPIRAHLRQKLLIQISFKITNSSHPLYCHTWVPLLVFQFPSS